MTRDVPWELSASAPVSIRAELAWPMTRGSSKVTVAVIDSGFDRSRLPANADVTIETVGDSMTLRNIRTIEHGTAIAQLIVGSRSGYPGVAPDCRFLGISVPLLSTEDILCAAFDLALVADASVICCAWGSPNPGPGYFRPLGRPVRACIDNVVRHSRAGSGAIVLVAAGNSSSNANLDGYVSHPLTTAVSGITAAGDIPSNADFGRSIVFVAPVSSKHERVGGELRLATGASAATALVAGVAALACSVNPRLHANQLIQILARSSWRPNRTTVLRRQAGGEIGWCGYGVPDASSAVQLARAVIPNIAKRRAAPDSSLRHAVRNPAPLRLRESRLIGGEHAYLGIMGARALRREFLNANASLESVFFEGAFAPFTNSSATFGPAARAYITAFLNPNGKDLSEGPELVGGRHPIPYGHLVALAGDLYGSPTVLRRAIFGARELGHPLDDLIEVFREEIKSGFAPDQDLRLIWLGSVKNLNSSAAYLHLAKRNYSHFAGDNLLFYLSYHRIAVESARAFGRADDFSPERHFYDALIAEAFALHFLTDMFSSGHARVPRWALMEQHPEDVATLLSRLLHQHEGELGVVLANARGQIWNAKGDGGLTKASAICDIRKNLMRWDHSSEPLTLVGRSEDSIPRNEMHPKHLAASLIFASVSDVIRNMAQGFEPRLSAVGTAAHPHGLLGYILERMPFAVPTHRLVGELRTALIAELGIDPLGSSMIERLGDKMVLYKSYSDDVEFILKFFGQRYSNIPLVRFLDLCETHLRPESVRSMVAAQIAHLAGIENAGGTSSQNLALADVPLLVGGINKRFGKTFKGKYKPPDAPLPQEWEDAIPLDLVSALLDIERGSWGVGV